MDGGRLWYREFAAVMEKYFAGAGRGKYAWLSKEERQMTLHVGEQIRLRKRCGL